MSTQQRKAREKEVRRQAILDAAESLMNESGVFSLNIDVVAARTQLAKGTIYLYFKNKEEILAAIALKARRLLLDEYTRMIADSPDPLSAIKGIILTNYTLYRKNAVHYDLVSLYETHNTLVETDELQQTTHDIWNLVIRLIDEAKAAGQVRADLDSLTFSMCLWGTTTGILQLIKVRSAHIAADDRLDEQRILDLFNDVLHRGIAR